MYLIQMKCLIFDFITMTLEMVCVRATATVLIV